MSEAVSSIAIVVILLLLLGMTQRRFERWERPWIWGALLAHCVAAVTQVVIVTQVYGGGDMMWYRRVGVMLADFMAEYPVEGGYEVLRAVFHQSDLRLPAPMRSGATAAMQAISGFVMLLVGGSIYGACLLFGGATLFAWLAVYRVFKRELDQEFHRVALIGCLWTPSFVFWSSALLKEAVAVVGVGLAIYGGHALGTRRRPLAGALLFTCGVVSAALVKPYLLLPFGLGVGMWLYLDGPRPAHVRRSRQLRPVPFVLGSGLAVAFVLGVGEVFPRFNAAGLAEQTADMQASLEWTEGGSDYAIGNPEVRTFTGQLAFAPLALLTALFRPTILDIHNPMSAVSAIETTAVTVLALMALLRSGPFGIVRAVFGSPILGFCAVYALGLALGVGLATTNLGTLSRYRMPMMPFFIVMVAVLAHRRSLRWASRPAPSSAPA